MKKLIFSLLFIILFGFFVYIKRSESNDIRVLSLKQSSAPLATTEREGQYKNGSYLGDVTDAYWGNIQIEAVIVDGTIKRILIHEYPFDRLTSDRINGDALPRLISEAIQNQTAAVDIVSGATNTSLGFQQSLGSALAQAQ